MVRWWMLSPHHRMVGMAENEYLDSRKARRWLAVAEWLAFLEQARSNGCRWSNLIDLPAKVA
jgi:hypothetical protein